MAMATSGPPDDSAAGAGPDTGSADDLAQPLCWISADPNLAGKRQVERDVDFGLRHDGPGAARSPHPPREFTPALWALASEGYGRARHAGAVAPVRVRPAGAIRQPPSGRMARLVAPP